MLGIIPAFIGGRGQGSRVYNLAGGSKFHLSTQPAEANVIWYMSGFTVGSQNVTKGYVQNDGYDSGDAISLSAGVAWTNPIAGFGTMYVRLTATSGTPDASSHAIDGSTWHTFTEDSTNIWWRQTNSSSVPELSTVLIELATDSGGTNIVDSGSYSTTVSSEN